MDRVLTLEEFAKVKGVHIETIRNQIKKGSIKAVYFHGGWKIRESELLDNEDSQDEYVSVGVASKKTNISDFLINRAISRGILPAKRTQSGEYRVVLTDLNRWVSDVLTGRRVNS